MDSADKGGRVLVFAPVGRDARASVELLQRVGIPAERCDDIRALTSELSLGVGAVIIAEEGLFGVEANWLFGWAADQPAWSDLPFIILTSRQERSAIIPWRHKVVAALRNVTLIERPLQVFTLTSAVQTALRARRRQYEVRALLDAQSRARADLEDEIALRTGELKAANRALRLEIDERARIAESLRQAQKIEALGQLTGGVAHDFNNLLMVISGGLEMLERQTDPERRRRLMEGMRHAAERGSGLTRQLLAFSRRQELKPKPIDLTRQIGGMRELLDRSLRGDVHVKFDFANELWPVEVDPGELELVVLNLAVNARDAMPNGGTILVSAHNAVDLDAAEVVRLAVVDTGTGMTPEVQARVFEPFFTTKEIGKGSGLGLAQVHGFAQQSGGSIRIESELGHGTTVEISLPRSYKTPSTDDRPVDHQHLSHPRRSNTGAILLVEDDDEVAALVSEMLEQLGYEVTRVATAVAALGALANGRPVDILFSDIMMPGAMDGVDLAREIRARQPGLPILLTSGYAQAAQRAADAEGVSILPKPYRVDELEAALARVRGDR